MDWRCLWRPSRRLAALSSSPIAPLSAPPPPCDPSALNTTSTSAYPRQTTSIQRVSAARLLVVEDDADIAAELEQALAGHGFTVGVAPTGAMALDAARAFPPELVLLDL